MLLPSDLDYINQKLLDDSARNRWDISRRPAYTANDGFLTPTSPTYGAPFFIPKPTAQAATQDLPMEGIRGPRSDAAKRRARMLSVAIFGHEPMICPPLLVEKSPSPSPKVPQNHSVSPQPKTPRSVSPEFQGPDGMRDCTGLSHQKSHANISRSDNSAPRLPVRDIPEFPMDIFTVRRDEVQQENKLAVLRANVAWKRFRKRLCQSASHKKGKPTTVTTKKLLRQNFHRRDLGREGAMRWHRVKRGRARQMRKMHKADHERFQSWGKEVLDMHKTDPDLQSWAKEVMSMH